jgi:glycine cleavage system aminomethyltransferase T
MGLDVEPCLDITRHRDASNGQEPEGSCFYCDYVYSGDEKIGISSGRIHDYYHRRMISLGFIDPNYAIEGQELKVLWGNPGERQDFIRVKVAHFPYYNEELRNETFDVSKIPSLY